MIEKLYLDTVLGRVPTSENHIWDAHVHLWGQPYHAVEDPDLILKDEGSSVKELNSFKAAGGSVVVEFSPYDFGRDWNILKRMAEVTGVHILTGTGFYRSAVLEPVLAEHSRKEWLRLIIDEAENGEEKTGAKPSFLKWSTSLGEITEAEKVSASIIMEAHKITDLPVVTHTQRGTMVAQQLEILRDGGVDFSKLLISHIDMRKGLSENSFLEVLEQGAWVSVDQLGKIKYGENSGKLDIVLKLCEMGYKNRILLATDIGRISNFKCLGGKPGIEHIPAELCAQLREKGASEELIKTLVCENPANFYGKT